MQTRVSWNLYTDSNSCLCERTLTCLQPASDRERSTHAREACTSDSKRKLGTRTRTRTRVYVNAA